MLNLSIILFAALTCIFGYAKDQLVVSYGTTHLNGIDKSVVGVLITPDNKELKTKPMGPFDHCTIVINSPEEGTYQVCFKALQTATYRLCSIVGGIVATLSDSPENPIILNPRHAQIQTFAAGKQIRSGDTTKPIGYFRVTRERSS